MMWGVIPYAENLSWCTSPVTLARYRDEVLTPHMLPSMNLRRDVCHHDNDRPHTAPATVVFLANQNVTVLRRPFKSLDFNPIEHLWDDLD